MQRLNNLTTILNDIKNISVKIINKALPLMKELQNDESDLLEILEENYTEIDRTIIKEILKNILLDLTEDSENIIKEIEKFTKHVIEGENSIIENEEFYPFFSSVWYGDIYGDTDIEGLNLLYKDLKKQYQQLNENYLSERSINNINMLE